MRLWPATGSKELWTSGFGQHFHAILGVRGPRGQASWASWRRVRIRASPGSLLGRSWPLLSGSGALLAAPGAPLGYLLGALGPLLDRSWVVVAPSWVPPGAFWGALGGSKTAFGRKAIIRRQFERKSSFGGFRGPPGGPWAASGGSWGALGRLLGGSWAGQSGLQWLLGGSWAVVSDLGSKKAPHLSGTQRPSAEPSAPQRNPAGTNRNASPGNAENYGQWYR